MIIDCRFTILHTLVFLVFLSRYCMHEWTVYPLHTVVVNLSSNIFCYNTECSSFSIVFLFSIGIILVRHIYFWLSSIFDISFLLKELKTIFCGNIVFMIVYLKYRIFCFRTLKKYDR